MWRARKIHDRPQSHSATRHTMQNERPDPRCFPQKRRLARVECYRGSFVREQVSHSRNPEYGLQPVLEQTVIELERAHVGSRAENAIAPIQIDGHLVLIGACVDGR